MRPQPVTNPGAPEPRQRGTEYRRVMATINRQGPDAIPWQFDLTDAVITRLQAHAGTEDWVRYLGDHFVRLKPKRQVETLPDGSVRDEYGVLWRLDPSIGNYGKILDYPLKGPSLDGYAFPEPDPDCWAHVPGIRAQYPDRFLVAEGGGIFQRAWALCGFENYLAYTASDPAFVEALCQGLTRYVSASTERAAAAGFDGIRFGDDWGFQDRLMLRAATWRRLHKPFYRRIYEQARRLGLVVMIHSCGRITELLPDVIELGVQVVHPLQPEAMDVEFCQRQYGAHLVFWGGVGSQSTIPNGTPEDVRREARLRLRQFAGGGYILAPSGAVPTETRIENLLAIAEVGREQLARG